MSLDRPLMPDTPVDLRRDQTLNAVAGGIFILACAAPIAFWCSVALASMAGDAIANRISPTQP